MFYSHDVLRSKEHGVATVWLVATLGSHSNLSRLGRKDILRVDVTKACRSIATPAAPMALRLQSNLLYGISRVFAEQCSYMLNDVQSATNGMRQTMRPSASSLLDVRRPGHLRSEHLLLADDPFFELSNNAILSQVQPVGNSDAESNSFTHDSYPGIMSVMDSQPRLVFESSPLGDALLFESLANPSLTPERLNVPFSYWARSHSDSLIPGNEEHIPGDADFTVDADGNVIGLDFEEDGALQPDENQLAAVVSAKVDTLVQNNDNYSNDIILVDDPVANMENVLQGPTNNIPRHQTVINTLISGSQGFRRDEDIFFDQGDAVRGVANMRGLARQRRKLDFDRGPLELKNSQVAAWNGDYLANMRQIKLTSQKTKHDALAKRNALSLVWLSGLGGSGETTHLRTYRTYPDPLCAFYGSGLKTWICGRRKRHHNEDDIDSGKVGKRPKRHTISADEERLSIFDDGGLEAVNVDNDIEIGRGASSLGSLALQQDHETFSSMPWNMGSGRTSSLWNRLRTRSQSSVTPLPQEQQSFNGDNRSFSDSPLAGLDNYEMLVGPGYLQRGDRPILMSDAIASDNDQMSIHPTNSPLVKEKHHSNNILDGECENFLKFVLEAIDARPKTLIPALENISFQELFPPESTASAVAAQALLITLSLSIVGLLKLEQAEHFATIVLTPTGEYEAVRS